MDSILLVQRLVLVFGVISWVGTWIVSAFLNFKFGFSVGGGGVSAVAFALIYLCLDISKGAVQSVFAKQESVFGIPKPLVKIYLTTTILISFFIASSFNMATRHQGVSKNQFQISQLSDQKSFIDELRLEKSRLGSPRSIELIDLEMTKLKRHPRWGSRYSDGCKNDTAVLSRQFCNKYRSLQAERISRSRLNVINGQLETRINKLTETGYVAEADPMTLFLAKVFTRPGGDVADTRNTIFFLLSLLTSAMVELWAGLGLSWLIFVAATGKYVPNIMTPSVKAGGDGGVHDPSFKPSKVERRKAVQNDNKMGPHGLIDQFYQSETKKVDDADGDGNIQSTTKFSDLYTAYKDFCSSKGQAPIDDSSFSNYSAKTGYWRRQKVGGVIYVVGCTLKGK